MPVTNTKAHVVLLPSPGIGHLKPMAQLAGLLVLRHNLTATIFTFSDLLCDIEKSILSSLPAGVSSITLPSIALDDLSSDTDVVTRISFMILRSVPFVRQTLINLQKNAHISAYIIDIFGGDTLPSAKELGIPCYSLFTSNFLFLSYMLYFSNRHDEHLSITDSPGNHLLSLPGCVPLRLEDLSSLSTDRSRKAYTWMVHHSKQLDRVDAIFVNSFEAMEGSAARLLRKRGNEKPSVIPIGPLVACGVDATLGLVTWQAECNESSSACMQWLDQQPCKSVLFISLGSGGTLTLEQMREMALGLEMSGQRFLWVVRAPSDANACSAYFDRACIDPIEFLPPGFAERIKEKGMVVSSWGPQIEVLSHMATGGFLSHCGWNSTLESIVNGVPMIAWPLYAEQPINAVMLVEETKVALRPRGARDGQKKGGGFAVIKKEEIAEVVQNLMEGEKGKELRRRISELKEEAVKAVGVGGSSRESLASIVNKWN